MSSLRPRSGVLDYIEVEKIGDVTWRAHGNNGYVERGKTEREAVTAVMHRSGLADIELTVARINLGRRNTHAIYALRYDDVEWSIDEKTGQSRFESEEEMQFRMWKAQLRSHRR